MLVGPKLKMVTFPILSTYVLEVMLRHWSKNSGRVPTCTTDEHDGDEVIDHNTSGMPCPVAALLPRVSGTWRCTSSWLSATLITVGLSIKARHFCQGSTIRLQHRPLLYHKPEPSLWLGSGTLHRGGRLGQSKGGSLLSLYQRPVDMTIKVSLTRRKRILNVLKKGKLASPDFTTLLEAELKWYTKIRAMLPTHLDTVLSRMSWILVIHAIIQIQLCHHQDPKERQ